MRYLFQNQKIGQILAWTAPVILFLLLLAVRIPSPIGAFFFQYSPVLFGLLLGLYALSFSLPGPWRWLTAFGLTMALFALSLSYQWSSGQSDAAVIGGLLPYKDSFHFYNGAGLILLGKPLPAYSQQAAWRPLFPGFLSALLLLLRQNLQWALAALFGLVGLSFSLSGEVIYSRMGKPAAVVYMTLLYLYVQPMVGIPATEPLGLIFGCLGFALLFQAGVDEKAFLGLYALAVLMLAVSVRAGAFFIFPLLAAWFGWRFRGAKAFSIQAAGLAALAAAGSFLVFNTLYTRLVVAAEGVTFSNFAFSLYGQVIGGAGWMQAIHDLGTTETAAVYQAAWQAFLRHPYSLLIAAVKSYRDFLLPGILGVFSFISPRGLNWLDRLVWFAGLLALGWGSVNALRERTNPRNALLLAAAAGIGISIPFLPPIDGGRRFYASTMPFFFALIALAFKRGKAPWQAGVSLLPPSGTRTAAVLSGLLLCLTLIFPVMLQQTRTAPILPRPACSANQKSFALTVNPGAYIDLAADDPCGYAPSVCLQDFLRNGRERKVDDFYRKLAALTGAYDRGMRILPANDLINDGFHYYIGSTEELGGSTLPATISGCAVEIKTRYQSIYQVVQVEGQP